MKLSPRVQRPLPPYQQIADHYRDLITQGTLKEGDRLPTVAEIADEWGVSPGTAHRGMQQLRGEKLVATNQQGTTVQTFRQATPAPIDRVHRASAVTHDRIEVREAGTVTARAYVGDVLGINADAGNIKVVRRESVTYRDGTPRILAVSWLPLHFAQEVPELTGLEPIPSLVSLIHEKGASTATHGRDWVTARRADEREAEALGISVGDPVLAGTSVWSNEEGPIEYREYVSPADHVISHEYTVNLSSPQ
ncbi:GntR family transcriptional regulator [Nocardiopsis sp. LOL_012]|uniref:GntR family transcriptional regulator n=1 Tax=Nocardiopsis sp. LOL_012 TaxID=3345409 RepID=UPI003A884956